MKKCTKCGVRKELSEFGRSAKYKDGYQHKCKACAKIYSAAFYIANKEKVLANNRAWSIANPDAKKAINREWRRANPQVGNAWSARNPEKKALINSRYQKAHPAKIAASSAKRRAEQTQATPGWANKNYIEDCYANAAIRTKRDGTLWHVDHIVPLHSPLVCGLHWEENLQVLPGRENIAKSNKRWPDMPERHI